MKLAEIKVLVLSDLYRYTKKNNTKTLIKNFFANSYFRFQVYLRFSKSNNFLLSFIFRLLKAGLGKKVNVQLNYNVPIGYGLYIPHGNVVVNSKSIIGNNCSLLQFVSIGSIHNGTSATIGDNVYIGPNVNLVGDINIGSNSVLGAGSVIVKNIDCNKVVVGSPGKVIKDVIDINTYNDNLCDDSWARKLKK
ncbi:serine acetyltransferase [Pseudoalteromonas sp. SWXJZ94C]|uniref:serine acetyltransferase n=1 Tax=Pseudoalteromonas sp. SWXJZ94C TaxID=2792065 RepID=UPI0018CD2D5D|nr:serine acetyltransferase [Pseudoalteromonas sp. SWXJZ94C]MBH0055736.1 serine acetyltransferase [Pseudoalteromonas sp. SWXJZ94C]